MRLAVVEACLRPAVDFYVDFQLELSINLAQALAFAWCGPSLSLPDLADPRFGSASAFGSAPALACFWLSVSYDQA